MKKNPRLRFTDAELDPRLKEHVRRADKAAAKADRAQSKLPKARKKTKRRMIEQARKADKTAKGGKGKAASRLMFEEDRPAPPSKLEHAVRAAPVLAAEGAVHQEIGKAGEDNAGMESAHALVLTAEGSGRVVESAYRAHKLKPYRAAARAERQLEKANINALYQKSLRDDPQLSSNPISRWRQKQAIKKEYAAAKRAGQTTVSAEKLVKDSAGAARQAAERGQKAAAFLRRNWKGVGVALGLFLVIGLLLNSMSSCTAFLEAGLSSLGGSTYPCQDADMLGAEAAYAGMEAELQSYLDTYGSTHDYDEYHFDLDEIGHDPYVLISILTAYHQGEWTLAQVQGTLEMLFGRQYTLTENVVVETRYRTETSTWTDEEGNTHTDTYQVPYDYYICYVTLENFDLSHLPVYIMGEDQVSLYAVYMATLGNRPDLFPQGEYPNASQREDYMDYDVPPEALADEQFAAMLAEAEKYLGYP